MKQHQAYHTRREKQIICGLFLSKYDEAALDHLGFQSFVEAFNALGFGLGAKPASIKNYRDELDPYFPNKRKGWHKRPLRAHCGSVLNTYGESTITELGDLIKSFLLPDNQRNQPPEVRRALQAQDESGETSFAKRLITGRAAEKYFSANYKAVPEFAALSIEDTTQWGCGFDFKLLSPSSADFLAVEVKGLRERGGQIQLTNLEYLMAESLRERYHLFLVRNFADQPFHTVIKNPLRSDLVFSKIERREIRVSWATCVADR
jgi:hypothetical protein